MDLYIINTGMSLSIVCFYLGYYYRFSNNARHRTLNTLGIVFNLLAAVYLLVKKYLMGGVEAMGIIAIVPEWAVLTHRFFAGVALLLMLAMGYTGWMRKKEVHRKLHFVFLSLYTIIFLSGLSIFKAR